MAKICIYFWIGVARDVKASPPVSRQRASKGLLDNVAGSMAGKTKSSLSFRESSMEERERILASGTLEQRKEAFKEDEELMRETTKFVTEVIETAATEASKRKTQTEGGDVGEGSRLRGVDGIAGWNHRARGFCNRILNALCPCFTNNELFAWTPYRYRFTRP